MLLNICDESETTFKKQWSSWVKGKFSIIFGNSLTLVCCRQLFLSEYDWMDFFMLFLLVVVDKHCVIYHEEIDKPTISGSALWEHKGRL